MRIFSRTEVRIGEGRLNNDGFSKSLKFLILCSLFAAFFAMICLKTPASANPWLRQAVQLKLNFRWFELYRRQNNGVWPASVSDIKTVAKSSTSTRYWFPFVNPDTGESSDWLVYSPNHTNSIKGYGHIIAAAPIEGGPDCDLHSRCRMVMFENAVVIWITEREFMDSTSFNEKRQSLFLPDNGR